MFDELVRTPDDQLLWNLLGVVEITYHPALAVAVLLAVDAVMSPVPAVTFDPLAITVTGQGLPVTRMFAVVALVELASDIAGVYGTSWTVTWGDGDE